MRCSITTLLRRYISSISHLLSCACSTVPITQTACGLFTRKSKLDFSLPRATFHSRQNPRPCPSSGRLSSLTGYLHRLSLSQHTPTSQFDIEDVEQQCRHPVGSHSIYFCTTRVRTYLTTGQIFAEKKVHQKRRSPSQAVRGRWSTPASYFVFTWMAFSALNSRAIARSVPSSMTPTNGIKATVLDRVLTRKTARHTIRPTPSNSKHSWRVSGPPPNSAVFRSLHLSLSSRDCSFIRQRHL